MGMAFWHLEYMGCEDVHVLDGGIQAWVEAGGQMDTDNVNAAITPVTFDGVQDNSVNVTTAELSTMVAGWTSTGNTVFLDGRPDSEYQGYVTKPFEPWMGRVPNSEKIWWWEYVDEATGKLKTPKECQALLDAKGVTKDKTVIHI